MGAEDFSYLLEGAGSWLLGTRPAGQRAAETAPNHSNKMVLAEDAMATGVALRTAVALRRLSGESRPWLPPLDPSVREGPIVGGKTTAEGELMQAHDKIYIDGAWTPSSNTARSTCTTPPTVRSSRRSRPAPRTTSTAPSRPPVPRSILVADLARGAGQVPDPRPVRAWPPAWTRSPPSSPAKAGMPKWLSTIIQADLPINSFNTAAALAKVVLVQETLSGNLVIQGAVGVVGAITPWNYRSRRSPPRSPTPSAPAAPWCSSPARWRRSTPSSSPRSSRMPACPPACSTWSPAPAPRWARPSPRTRASTW